MGTATAMTPILDEPLTGPVYFVKNVRKDPKSGRRDPDAAEARDPARGSERRQAHADRHERLLSTISLVTTFDNIPDAPVSSLQAEHHRWQGRHPGRLRDADICKATQIADQQIDGQNNKNADTDVYIQTPSCPLKVLSKKIGKTSVAVKVGGLGAGKVTVTGKGIKKTTKTITKSTVATITAKRTKAKPGKVTVSSTRPARPRPARPPSRPARLGMPQHDAAAPVGTLQHRSPRYSRPRDDVARPYCLKNTNTD